MIQRSKQHDRYFTALRGIAITFVIAIHTFQYKGTALYEEIGDYFLSVEGLQILIRQLVGCAVPLFLAVSGFFLGSRNYSYKDKCYIDFILKQSRKVYIPMLIWSMPFYIIGLSQGNSILFWTIFTIVGGVSIMYYIPLILQFYVLLPVFNKQNLFKVLGSVAITLLFVIFIIHVQIESHNGLVLFYYAAPFPAWLCFYSVGCYIGQKHSKISQFVAKNKRTLILTYVLFLFLSSWEFVYLNCKYDYSSQLRPLSTLANFLAVTLLLNGRALLSGRIRHMQEILGLNYFKSILYSLGEYSFVIYLSHMLFLTLVPELFGFVDSWTYRFLMLLIVDFSGCILLSKIIPNKLKPILGLPRSVKKTSAVFS